MPHANHDGGQRNVVPKPEEAKPPAAAPEAESQSAAPAPHLAELRARSEARALQAAERMQRLGDKLMSLCEAVMNGPGLGRSTGTTKPSSGSA